MLAATACIFGISVLNAEEKVYQVGEDGVSAPTLTHKVEPEYSETARDAGISGEVIVSLHINKQGGAENIKVVTGLHPDLDRNAVAAVVRWQGTRITPKVLVDSGFRHILYS